MAKFDPGHPILARINAKSNTRKGECYFIGFIDGIISNRRVDDSEVEPLLAECEAFCANFRDDDAREILEEAKLDYVNSSSELLALLECISDVRSKNIDSACLVSSTNRLLGFCAGVACDGIITTTEARELLRRLRLSSDIQTDSRITKLIDVCSEALADGIVDEAESQRIAELIARIVGDCHADTGLSNFGSMPTFSDFELLDRSDVTDAHIVLTGVFDFGRRSDVAAILTSLGGTIDMRISKKTDLLILGSEAARDWKYASMGRKMQSALELIDSGQEIRICAESQLRKLFSDLKTP